MLGKDLYSSEPVKIALVAHDGKKPELLEWVNKNKRVLSRHYLYGTGTTGSMIRRETGLFVSCFKSGPLGGDQQIGAKIAEGELDVLIFFWDPLSAAPHDQDVKALIRIAVLYDIPSAYNAMTANMIFAPAHAQSMQNDISPVVAVPPMLQGIKTSAALCNT